MGEREKEYQGRKQGRKKILPCKIKFNLTDIPVLVGPV